jgi:hypothetical protein
MITTINGKDTIKILRSGDYRTHRKGVFWIGDYASFKHAERALQISNSSGSSERQHGFYDGGVHANEATHLAAHNEVMGLIFGHDNCVTQDDIDRTIIAGESCKLQGGFPVRT